MKLIYHRDRRSPNGNFGDELNRWLWPKLAPELFGQDDGIPFLGIGTILGLPGFRELLEQDRFKIVFGSGAGIGKLPYRFLNCRFYCVRGPLTAEAIGLERRFAICDPAILIRALNDLAQPQLTKRHRISFMPHISSNLLTNWKRYCGFVGVNYIDPTKPVDQIIDEIRHSELMVAQAMHGAIVADALRVPWIPMGVSPESFKWKDWCHSLDLSFQPITLPYSWPSVRARGARRAVMNHLKLLHIFAWLWRMAEKKEPFLSSDVVIDRAVSRLLDQLAELRRDYA